MNWIALRKNGPKLSEKTGFFPTGGTEGDHPLAENLLIPSPGKTPLSTKDFP